MNDRVDTMLMLLRRTPATAWVADQVTQSFAQGISMNVKEASEDDRFSALEPAGLSTPEKRKREKYETTRQYSYSEKLQLLREAVMTFFVELPAVQAAAISGLQELGSRATDVDFVPQDEPEQGRAQYTTNLARVSAERDILAANFVKFDRELMS